MLLRGLLRCHSLIEGGLLSGGLVGLCFRVGVSSQRSRGAGGVGPAPAGIPVVRAALDLGVELRTGRAAGPARGLAGQYM